VGKIACERIKLRSSNFAQMLLMWASFWAQSDHNSTRWPFNNSEFCMLGISRLQILEASFYVKLIAKASARGFKLCTIRRADKLLGPTGSSGDTLVF
jgi:hypothetical protein